MAIGTAYDIGGNTAAAGSNSLAFTLSHAVTAGDAVFVALGTGATTVTPTGVTHNGGAPTTLTQVSSVTGNSQAGYLYVVENAAALSTSIVMTSAWSGTAQTSAIRASNVSLVTGLTPGGSDVATAFWNQNGSGCSDTNDGHLIVKAVQ